MNKHLSALLGLVLASAFSAPVLAQDDEGGGSGDNPPEVLEGRPYYVSPMFTYLLTDGARGTGDAYGLTLAVGKKLTYGLNLELTGFFAQASSNPPSGFANNGDLQLSGIGVTAMLFPLRSFPNFYGVFSIAKGGAKKLPGAVPSYTSTIFDSGLGYLYPLTERVILRVEGRYHMDSMNRSQAGVKPGKSDFYDGELNAGVLIPLGALPKHEMPKTEEASPEVASTDSGDADGDGVPDASDQCPGTPAGAVVDEKGCEADADGDGVPDRLDKCPDTPAGTQVNASGCSNDADGDGVLDDVDECPQTPAGAKVLANGCGLQSDCRTPRPGEQVDSSGCAASKAFILKGVVFEYDSTRLTEDAEKVLDGVAETLKGYPDIKVEIAGHTDSYGSDSYNQGLSEKRAIAVKDYLTSHGIDAARMKPTGYGESQPIDNNATEAGRANNRRVELRVIDGEAPAAAEAPAASAPAEDAAPADAPADAAAPADAPAADAAAPSDQPAQ